MDNTMLIQVTNQKALNIIYELQELNVIKVLRDNVSPATTRLSEKYKGIINKEQAQKLNEHIEQMRNEWSNT